MMSYKEARDKERSSEDFAKWKEYFDSMPLEEKEAAMHRMQGSLSEEFEDYQDDESTL